MEHFRKKTSLSLPEDGIYNIPSCRLNVAANKHVPVIDSKQNYFNLLPNMSMCIVLSVALWCVKILRVFIVPPCLIGSGRYEVRLARHLVLCCPPHAQLHGRWLIK